jgi:hypothetical protein
MKLLKKHKKAADQIRCLNAKAGDIHYKDEKNFTSRYKDFFV